MISYASARIETALSYLLNPRYLSVCFLFFFLLPLILANLLQKSDMVEEAIRFGARLNGDSGFRVSPVHRFGSRARNFGSQHDMQRDIEER